MRIVVLQHVDCEPPAAYLPVLADAGPVLTIRLGVDELPGPEGIDAIVAMGGPMGVNDIADHPWLRNEVDFIADVLSHGGATWGVCLGAQLLAAALGARVYPGPAPEVGVDEVTLTAEAAGDPVFAALPAALPALHWHGDTFDLPDGAARLASSPHYQNQAFRHGSSYGLQFHLETPAALAQRWLELAGYRNSLQAALGEEGEKTLLADLRSREAEILAAATTAMTRWTTLLATAKDRPSQTSPCGTTRSRSAP